MCFRRGYTSLYVFVLIHTIMIVFDLFLLFLLTCPSNKVINLKHIRENENYTTSICCAHQIQDQELNTTLTNIATVIGSLNVNTDGINTSTGFWTPTQKYTKYTYTSRTNHFYYSSSYELFAHVRNEK